MATALPLRLPTPVSHRTLKTLIPSLSTLAIPRRRPLLPARVATSSPPFRLFDPPPEAQSATPELDAADPDFYRIGYARSVRAYGVEFKEGPNGFGVYASRDVEPLRRARMIMEIPLELMLTISEKVPWMFFPDIVPVGHPIFDIINSTNPETDWDLRLACLLLFAFDVEGNFWQLYGDFLPSTDECTNLLLARKVRVEGIDEIMHTFTYTFMLDMLNHSFQPNCFLHWRFKDRMLEVMINAGQAIKKGEEMTINYMNGKQNGMVMERYGFSSSTNPWDAVNFSGNAQIHLDSFLSIFNISGLPEEYCHNSQLSNGDDDFVDGAVIAAARTLPTWSEGDMPPVPSIERKAARELQEECRQMLAEFPTTFDQDQKILDSNPEASRTLEAAIKYRLHRKLFLRKVIQTLEIYQDRILF